MSRIEVRCPVCNRHTGIRSTLQTRSGYFHIYECGDYYEEPFVATQSQSLIEQEQDIKWLAAFPYQRTGVEFVERSNINCLIGDDMGLGKTIQAILTLRRNYDLMKPCLIVVPPALVYKWQRELKKWFSDKYNNVEDVPLINFNSSGNFLDNQNIYIVSNAIISRPAMLSAIHEYRFKTVIIDEGHQFKNDSADRTKAMIQIASWVDHVLILSGTSITNRVMEYFNTLHMINPQHWPHKGWLDAYCDHDRKGRALGLSSRRRDAFFERTKDYIIRRTKNEVLKDLPEKQVNYEFIGLNTNKNFVKDYNKLVDELEAKISEIRGSLGQTMQLIAIMSKMRHIIALAKVPHVIEMASEWLENVNGNAKLAIGVHHKLNMEWTAEGLARWNPICISDESAKKKDELENEFRSIDHRLAILSIRGCGVGRDMQFCNNVMVTERDWNSALETQFQDRFHRIGTANKVVIDYVMAAETLDEYFHDKVELTRQIQGSTLDKDFSTDSQFIMELAERVVEKRIRYAG